MNDNRVHAYGATLYLPALHPTLQQVRAGSVPRLAAMVICLEDAVRDDEVPAALSALREHLASATGSDAGPLVYVRPRSVAMMDQLLAMRGIEDVRGFVVPKATADTLPDWAATLRGGDHAMMPTIETIHAFDQRELHRLRDQILTMGTTIDMIRIGGNDILSTIGARRSVVRTLYDGPLGPVVAGIVGAFAGTDIEISSPVLEHYADEALLREEVARDVEHGLFNKTAIHPKQVPIINEALKPSIEEVAEATAILDDHAKAVFGMDGSMCEPKTHAAWARRVLARRRALGIRVAAVEAVAI